MAAWYAWLLPCLPAPLGVSQCTGVVGEVLVTEVSWTSLLWVVSHILLVSAYGGVQVGGMSQGLDCQQLLVTPWPPIS